MMIAANKSSGSLSGKKYKAKLFLNSKAEQNLFLQIQEAYGRDVYINCKVRLADLVDTINSRDMASFNRICSKHIDFILIDPKTSKIVCAVELDDKSHNSRAAMKRDSFKDAVLQQCAIPLIRIRAAKDYHTVLEQTIKPFVQELQVNQR